MTQLSAKIQPSKTLPPELWLIIFDFVMSESGVGLLAQCDRFTFPETLNQLRHPWRCRPTGIPALRNLRLVSRASNALLKSSPYLILKKPDTSIVPSTRAVFIYPCIDAQVCLRQLLSLPDPSMSQRIVILDVPGIEYRNSSVPFLFDVLCENAHSLPSVRSLSLGLQHYTSQAPATIDFWGRLNDAFPHLVCLVLRGCLKLAPSNSTFTFQQLEILDLDVVYPQSTVYFPALRHAAFGSMTSYSCSPFRGWSLLESLLLRSTSYIAEFDWSRVPHLLLLGVPSENVNKFARTPEQHPLQHLYIFVGTNSRNDHYQDPDRKEKEFTWMNEVLEQFPTVTRITLAYPRTENYLAPSISAYFDDEQLDSMGLSSSYGASSGESRIIFTRITPKPRTEPPIAASSQAVEPNPPKNGLRGDWNRLRRFASRTLHL